MSAIALLDLVVAEKDEIHVYAGQIIGKSGWRWFDRVEFIN
jgi:hypothetical protein